MDVPAIMAGETALARQNVALSAVKQSAEQGEKLAKVIEESAQTLPVNQTRGTNVDVGV